MVFIHAQKLTALQWKTINYFFSWKLLNFHELFIIVNRNTTKNYTNIRFWEDNKLILYLSTVLSFLFQQERQSGALREYRELDISWLYISFYC